MGPGGPGGGGGGPGGGGDLVVAGVLALGDLVGVVVDLVVAGGPGWGPGPGGPGGPGFGPGPGGFFGGCANGLCNMISSCFYCLCCCWLLRDCFGGPRGPSGPPGGPHPY
ncbi:Glycine-rich protein [Quillaja saponaria]|uniref:Glycine-rich protein n=1 Tax=Quillaja saponaria TaxID=32244 RepID=A0AAD7VEM6_QUISA|nr:Glycine-rich protein [Quillaja saponaria]